MPIFLIFPARSTCLLHCLGKKGKKFRNLFYCQISRGKFSTSRGNRYASILAVILELKEITWHLKYSIKLSTAAFNHDSGFLSTRKFSINGIILRAVSNDLNYKMQLRSFMRYVLLGFLMLLPFLLLG